MEVLDRARDATRVASRAEDLFDNVANGRVETADETCDLGNQSLPVGGEDEDEDQDEDLWRIRRRERTEVEEESAEEESDEDAEGRANRSSVKKRRLKRANGERIEREDGDAYDSSDLSDLEEEDEELMMERKYAETGRLTDDEDDLAEAEEERPFASVEDYSSDSSEDLGDEVDKAPSSGGKPRKMTKKQMKAERKALAAEQERLMRKAEKRARFPGWDAVPERVSYMPLIEKIRAAVARIAPNTVKETDRVETPPEAPPLAQPADSEQEDEVFGDEIEFDDNDEDDEDLKAMLAKKATPKIAADVPEEPEIAVTHDDTTGEEAVDDDSEESEDEDNDSEADDLSEEEDMTEEERRAQRKAAKRFIRADKKRSAQRANREFFEDEAEMSEDGGHSTDEDDDNVDDEDLDDIAEGIDFREEQPEDERRAAARARTFMKQEQKADEADVEKMKEMLANGFRRKRGLLDSEDGWKRKRRDAGGEEESDEDIDFGPVIERPEDAVELSDDDDGEWREQAARRRELQNQPGAQDSQLPDAFESVVSQDIFAAVKGRMNSFSGGESQEIGGHSQGWEIPFARSNSGPPALNRTSSQMGSGSSSMLSRQPSKTFLGKKRQVTKANGPVLGNGQASRSYVFGRNDSQSQWGGEETAPATTLREIGRDEDARSFGATNVGNASSKKQSDASVPKKQSLFEMLQSQTASENQASQQNVSTALRDALNKKK